MKRYEALLFDLDGTLLDSRQSVIEATYQTVLHFKPGSFSYADIDQRFGEPFTYLAAALGMESEAETLLRYYLAQVEANHDRLTRPFPFVTEGIAQLRAASYRLAIVTNKERRLVLRGLAAVGLQGAFDTIHCIEDVAHGKPAPDLLLQAMNELNVKPEQCLMIGDTRFDILAAQRAGADSCFLEQSSTCVAADVSPSYTFATFQAFFQQVIACKNGSDTAAALH